MNENVPPIQGPKGYLSEQDKRSYTLKAGILGAVFFVAQFVIPIVIMFPLMFSMPFWGFATKRLSVEEAAWWQNKVWAVATRGSFGNLEEQSVGLISLEVSEDAEPVGVYKLSEDDTWLLPDGERLWLISADKVSCYSGGQMKEFPQDRLGTISHPFLYNGRPAVVDMRPTEDVLRVFEVDRWRAVKQVRLRQDEFSTLWPDNLRILSDNSTLHVFLEEIGTVYYRRGLPSADSTDEEGVDSWEPVVKVGGEWTTLLLDGKPVVLRIDQQEFNATVIGCRFNGESWEQFFRHKAEPLVMEINAFAVPGRERFILLLGSGFGGMKVLDVRDGAVFSENGYGSSFPFPKGFMAIMFIPNAIIYLLPVFLAIIISIQMRRHRVCEYSFGGFQIQFASMTRRAVAQIVDSVLMAWPIALGYIVLFWNFENMFNPLNMLAAFGLIGLGFLWAFALLFVFSYLEGRYGRTPGKWVAGIRVVGTDLRPCGFGRAIIRNLLKFVDGFFNFMVGILVAALTENWQRIGDLAGRTIVVRGPLPESAAQSAVPPPAPSA